MVTKKEIYQALADGRATSVQRRFVVGEKWVTAESEHRLVGWLTSDADRFNETRYRFKPTPVPPGDLTWEEAEAAFKRGEKVEWWSDCDASWNTKVSAAFNCKTAYRLAPAPKMRTVRAEELPAVFWIRHKGCTTSRLVRAMQTTMINTDEGWFSLQSLVVNGATYSEHHSKGPWLKFEVEEK